MNARGGSNARLQVWLDEYEGIADEFVEAVSRTGAEFGGKDARRARVESLLAEVGEKGALLRNGCASVSSGPVSEACVACSSSSESKTFAFSLKCHRSCYFCFNPNQDDYEAHLRSDRDWRGEFARIAGGGRRLSHVALTGGEPLLRPDEACAFFSEARRLWPDAHLRLYTTGDQLTEGMLSSLVDAGLNEIRFSVKPDEDPASYDHALGNLRMACSFAARLGAEDSVGAGVGRTAPGARDRALDVMVEMPVLPGSFDEMRQLLDELEAMGAFGVNLLEFCYPFNNWPEFARRGFRLKNPPYEVPYDYEYAGSLAIEGSEEACLELVRYALEAKLGLGVHYCSLENKHRMQIHRQNHPFRFADPCYELDPGDFFLKTVKVFDPDADAVTALLEACFAKEDLITRSWRYDGEEGFLALHPRLLPLVKGSGVTGPSGERVACAESVNVVERKNGALVLRELGLRVI